MRFQFPMLPAEFEIPDDWLNEAGLQTFKPKADAYRSDPTATRVPLIEIEPPCRWPAVQKDWRGFDRKRLIEVLQGFVADALIPAVPVIRMPQPPAPLDPGQASMTLRSPFNYRSWDGYHRFHASIAAGFRSLPVMIT